MNFLSTRRSIPQWNMALLASSLRSSGNKAIFHLVMLLLIDKKFIVNLEYIKCFFKNRLINTPSVPKILYGF